MEIILKDGSKKQFENGKMIIDIIKEISPSLAKKAIVAKLNNELVDLKTVVNGDSNLEILTMEDKESYEVLNHSAAHLVAHAVSRLYENTGFGVGPSIEEGFYYDFSLKSPIAIEDLPKIEAEMKKIVKENISINSYEVTKDEAKEMFKHDKFKVELIDAVNDTNVRIYEQKDYKDVCRGPHVISTSILKNFKLLNVAGAYWRGDSKNEMLTRIYGTCFFTEEDLTNHLNILEERKKRDHRKIGKELGLFMISDFGPGLPFWLPNGYTLRRTLENFWINLHRNNDYKIIQSPIMLSKELWEISGHWDHYKENMYITNVDENEFAIKPMNCPGAILVYKNELHSYKDLPMRIAELGHVHRHEASGALNGLFRVRTFTQDDAHTMLTEDQLVDEIARILALYDQIYSLFNLDYSIELSTRPEDNYIGTLEVWNKAEEALTNACLKTGKAFKINPGDGAFYGPKLDFKLRDSMNRIWQCGTIQLDMNLPTRFDCTYINSDGEKATPVMIHRAIFGSLERFIAIITENYAGAFPAWLAPVQVKIIPVNKEYHLDYSMKLEEIFKKENIRFETDYRDEKLGYKIREAQTKKIPYSLVIGDNEINNNLVTYRKFGQTEQITITINEFLEIIKNHNENLN